MTYPEWIQDVISRGMERGIKVVDLAYLVDKPYDSVRKYVAKKRDIDELGEPVVSRKHNKTHIIKKAIEAVLENDPKTPYRALPAALEDHLPPETDIPSASSCYRIMKEIGFVSKIAVKRNFISTANQLKRFKFAEEYLQKSDSFWDRIIWSDETMVRKAPQGKELRFWTRPEADNKIELVNHQIQQGGFGVMFWGCFSKYGFGPLVIVEGSMDTSQYKEIIKDHLLPCKEQLECDLGTNMILMQDNAPCHKSKRSMDFLRDYDVETLPWPAQSPDLNPIENLWAIIKKRRLKNFGVPATKDDLIQQIFSIWNDLEPELAETLADSAAGRLRECMARKGGHSGY